MKRLFLRLALSNICIGLIMVFLSEPLSVLSLMIIVFRLYFNVVECGKLVVIDGSVLLSSFAVIVVHYSLNI